MLEISVNELHKTLQHEIYHCIESHQVLHVKQSNGENFVILSAVDWRSIEETLFLNQIPHLVESIQTAAKEPLSEGTRLEDLEKKRLFTLIW